MLPDTRTISRHGDFVVLAERQPIIFRDNSGVFLHRVRKQGFEEVYLRAMPFQGVHWCIFDLRDIQPSFGQDFRSLLERDHPGVVLFTLREQFGGDAEFIARAFREFVHVWTDEAAEPLLILGAGPAADRVTFQHELRFAA